MCDIFMRESLLDLVYSLLYKRLHTAQCAQRIFFLNFVNPNQILIVITIFRYKIKCFCNYQDSDINKTARKKLPLPSEKLAPLVIK